MTRTESPRCALDFVISTVMKTSSPAFSPVNDERLSQKFGNRRIKGCM